MTNLTTQHIQPAMVALLAARDHDAAGDDAGLNEALRLAGVAINNGLSALHARPARPAPYVVPVDPQDDVNCEACQ